MTGGKYLSISSYLREYARITLASIKTPRKFFEEIKSEGKSHSKPLAYMLISYTVFIAVLLLGMSLTPLASEIFTSSYIIKEVVNLYIWFVILFFISVALMHLAVIIVRGKGKLNHTFKVMCYSVSPLNFAGLFILMIVISSFRIFFISKLIANLLMLGFFISMLYIFYIVVVGISVTSEISGSRAFAALMIQLFIFALIPIILVYALTSFHQYDTSIPPDYSPRPHATPIYENYNPPNPEKYKITAYAGSPPKIDGAVTEEDKWYEGERFIAEEKERDYYITIKHDFENIYILMEWEGPFEENGNIAIHFEQDTNVQDFNLSNGRVDSYYQGFYRDGNFSIYDTHYDSGIYTDKERQDGYLKGGYKNGRWTLEWRIPMNSGDKYDIYINNYPTEVGFSITNTLIVPVGNVPVSIFPPGADDYDPLTWANMVITDNKLRYRIS